MDEIFGHVDKVKARDRLVTKISRQVPENMRSDKEPEIIARCKSQNMKFTDPEFPPETGSLVGRPPRSEHDRNWNSIAWARAPDVIPHMKIFEGISPNDINQGEIGDCYFLCCLSALAERPVYIERLFDTDKVNEQGVYAVWLNINGMWREIILDDYIPVRKQNNGNVREAFSHSSSPEIWVNLLEKAYAKVYGDYDSIVGGDPVYAMRDLTGAPFFRVEPIDQNLEDSWHKIKTADERNWMITCYTKNTKITEEQNDNGIVSGHAYTVLQAAEVRDSQGNPARIV